MVQIVVSVLALILAVYYWRILVLIVIRVVLFGAIGSLFGENWIVFLAILGFVSGLFDGIKDRRNAPVVTGAGDLDNRNHPGNKKLVLHGILSLAILTSATVYNNHKAPKSSFWSKAGATAEWVLRLNPLGRVGKWFRTYKKR